MSEEGQAGGRRILAFGLGDGKVRAAYDELFEACPDAFIQQSTLWAEVIAPLGPDEPRFFLVLRGGEAIAGLPLYLYRHPDGNVVTSVPQAGPLGGVFCRPGLDPDEREAATRELVQEGRQWAEANDAVALSLITDPFAPEPAAYHQELRPDYRLENFCQWTDLERYFAADGSVAWPGYHRRSNLRRNLGRAREAGLRVRLSDDPAEMERLYPLHLKRHSELAAAPLDPRLFQNIANILVPRGKAFVLVVESGTRLASWGVYLQHRHVLDVLRLNMESDFAGACPNFLNTDESLRLARMRGVRCYNWQSSPDRDSGVYRYKVQWAAQEAPYSFLTRLFRPPSFLSALGLDRLRRNYPLHFIAPYAAAGAGFAPGTYRKG